MMLESPSQRSFVLPVLSRYRYGYNSRKDISLAKRWYDGQKRLSPEVAAASEGCAGQPGTHCGWALGARPNCLFGSFRRLTFLIR